MAIFGNMAFESLKKMVINPAIKGIGTVRSISYKDHRLSLTATLDGLDGVLIEITCGTVIIAGDGSSVTVADFTSNMPFAENALNRFAARAYAIPDNSVARGALKTAKKVMGI